MQNERNFNAIIGMVLGVILKIYYGNAAEKQDKSMQKLIWALLAVLALLASLSKN